MVMEMAFLIACMLKIDSLVLECIIITMLTQLNNQTIGESLLSKIFLKFKIWIGLLLGP